ncbi:MAG: T9SS type A sorting domain-containing protein, partial [Bacteroidales bacterium]|nr:T9SS type A sorting domain-containing protein [Bacteroidales bacterium]
PEADDTFTKNIASGIQTVTFSGLNSNTSYDFEIFPYTNSGSNIDYKTAGTIPSASGTTTDTPTNCGNETFDGLTTGSSSYLDDSFTGQDGSTWNYTDSRTDQSLGNGAAICVRNGYVESGTIPNGINDMTISTQRVYSGGTGNITIKINNNVIGTVPYSDVLQTNTISGINISGDIVLKFETPGNGDRVVIDDIIWTCNGGSANNTLPEFTSSPVTTATSGQTYTYNITATDADGDNLTITAPTKPAWLTFTDNGNGTAVLTGIPSNSDVGDNDVILAVSDDIESVNQNFTITVTAASYVTDKSNNKISIYPNPTKHSVDIISSEKIISVKMKNIIGKTIINKENINSKTYRLNLNNLSKGIYFIEITGITNNKIVKKIIKE